MQHLWLFSTCYTWLFDKLYYDFFNHTMIFFNHFFPHILFILYYNFITFFIEELSNQQLLICMHVGNSLWSKWKKKSHTVNQPTGCECVSFYWHIKLKKENGEVKLITSAVKSHTIPKTQNPSLIIYPASIRLCNPKTLNIFLFCT